MDYLPEEKKYRRLPGDGFEVFITHNFLIEIRQDAGSEDHAIVLMADEAEDLVKALNELIVEAKKPE